MRLVFCCDPLNPRQPDHADVDGFYKALRDHWPAEASRGSES